MELNAQQQRLVALAIRSGAYHYPDEVIDTALSMLAEYIADGMLFDARSHEPRSTLTEVQAELCALGDLE